VPSTRRKNGWMNRHLGHEKNTLPRQVQHSYAFLKVTCLLFQTWKYFAVVRRTKDEGELKVWILVLGWRS
jgi:hypothetical protein